jgi:hypothetical protein
MATPVPRPPTTRTVAVTAIARANRDTGVGTTLSLPA